MAVPVLNDYEYQLDEASNGGVLLNPTVAGVAASLPFVDVTNVDGLDSAEVRTAQSQHEGTDGSWVDSDFYNQRVVVVEGMLYADPSNAEAQCDAIKTNWAPSKVDKPFYFKHPGVAQRFVLGKPQGARYSISNLRRTGQTPFQATLICGDPYIYGTAYSSNRSGAGTLSINPGGSRDAWPIVTLTSSFSSGLTLRNNTLSRILTLNFSQSVGSTTVIDMRKRTVLQNGLNKRGSVTGQFWWLEPNVANSYQSTGTPGTQTITGNATFD